MVQCNTALNAVTCDKIKTQTRPLTHKKTPHSYICWEYFGQNWPQYNGTTVFYLNFLWHPSECPFRTSNTHNAYMISKFFTRPKHDFTRLGRVDGWLGRTLNYIIWFLSICSYGWKEKLLEELLYTAGIAQRNLVIFDWWSSVIFSILSNVAHIF